MLKFHLKFNQKISFQEKMILSNERLKGRIQYTYQNSAIAEVQQYHPYMNKDALHAAFQRTKDAALKEVCIKI